MAITLSDNFDFWQYAPDFARQQFASLEEMKNVSKSILPTMYIAYCTTTRRFYTYDETNAVDPTLGKWRELSTQTTSMPLANVVPVGTTFQYLGETTADFTKGFFYTCIITSESTQTVDVVTLEELNSFIDASEATFKVNTGKKKVNKRYYEFNGKKYYNHNDVTYFTENDEGAIDTDTQLADDNDVVAQHITKDITTYTYGWSNLPTGPSSFQVTDLPTADESQAGKVYQYIGETDQYTQGYFYECAITGSQIETHDPQTIDVLKYDIEHYPTGTIQVNTGSDPEELDCLLNYYIYDNTIYKADNEIGDISTDTALATDEMVAGEQLMYEVDAPVYDWVQKNVQPGGSGGASTASDVSYENQDHSSLTNVEEALDNILAKIYYVEPKINSFTMSPSTTEYEIGASVSNLVFNWTTNKEITVQTLTDCTLADATVRTATAAGPYTSNKTFTLSIGDGENTATSSKSISFKHKVYWGSAAEPNGAYDSAFILALSNKKFATNYKGTYSMTVAQDEFGYLAYPSSWGTVTSWFVGGFEVTVQDCGEVSFTNASGNTTTFRVIRTTQPSLGAISPEIK